MFQEGELNQNRVIIMHEAHIGLDGYVNKQNYQFRGSDNPQISKVMSLHPLKMTVWAAISFKSFNGHS